MDFDKGVTTTAQEIGPDGATRRLFSNLSDFRGFAVIDFAAHKEVARIQLLDEPNGVLLGEKLRRRNRIPTHGNEVSPDGKTLWLVSQGASGVFVYSLSGLKVINFIPTPRVKGAPDDANGGDPGWITFTADGKTAYVSNAAANIVSAIDAKTMKEVAEIPVGEQPDHVFTLGAAGKETSRHCATVAEKRDSVALRLFAIFALSVFLASCAMKQEVKGNPDGGKELFDSTCDVCHYANSTVARAGPGLAGLYKKKTLRNGTAVNDANVERYIRDGSSLMPGYRNMISHEQMRDLIAYLKML